MFSEAETDPRLPKEYLDRQEPHLRTALLNAQYKLLNNANHALIIVIAGIDGVGKGDTINLLNEWMDPRHIHTLSFGPPTAEELEYPRLWRYWNDMPGRGRIGIVFGSWYMDMLAEAASKHPDQKVLEQETDRVRRFEAMLTANNVQIIKLWYHLSAKAQAARTKRLLASPETSWQVAPADRKVPKNFDRLRQAGKTALTLTDAAHAPWFVIPSADEDLRTVRTAETVLAALHRHTSPVPATAHIPQQKPKPRRVPDRLGKLDYTAHIDKDTYDTERNLLQGRLARASRSPKFTDMHTLVLAFEGQDAAGKGGAIRRVTRALDARQYQITPVAAPVSYERARPYLWRFWKELPRRGRIVIFDRSWYGRVLVERVENIIHPADWHRAYGEINHFEQQLVESGAIVLKFWMAITSEVQLKRFHEREFSPYKNFKLTPEDWRNRKRWDDYAQAANEMFAHTDTPDAPWLVIPANNKHYARVQVLKHIVDAVETRL